MPPNREMIPTNGASKVSVQTSLSEAQLDLLDMLAENRGLKGKYARSNYLAEAVRQLVVRDIGAINKGLPEDDRICANAVWTQ